MKKHSRNFFGTYLRELREARNLSLQKATVLLNLPNRVALHSWENDVTVPPDEILKKLAEIYAVDPLEVWAIFEVE